MNEVKAYKSNGKLIEACNVDKITAYKSVDGQLFESKDEALEHDEIIRNTEIFAVYSHPDLTEGSRGALLDFLVTVNAERNRQDLIEFLCYRKYGNKFDFVMGVKCCNNIMKAWDVVKVERTELDKYLKGNTKMYFLDADEHGVFNDKLRSSVITMETGFDFHE